MALQFDKNFVMNSVSLGKVDGDKNGDIPTSKDISGIELRLSKVLIKDNGTPKIPPFPGLAGMYLVILVIDDIDSGELNLRIKDFSKVDDMEELPIERTIYYWKKTQKSDVSPGQIHALVSVVKSKQSLREVGDILTDVYSDENYNDLIDTLKEAVSDATKIFDVSNALLSVASIVGRYLGKVKDKAWITWVQSFTDLRGDLDSLGKTTYEQDQRRCKLVIDLYVRDKNREKAVLMNEGFSNEEIEELVRD